MITGHVLPGRGTRAPGQPAPRLATQRRRACRVPGRRRSRGGWRVALPCRRRSLLSSQALLEFLLRLAERTGELGQLRAAEDQHDHADHDPPLRSTCQRRYHRDRPAPCGRRHDELVPARCVVNVSEGRDEDGARPAGGGRRPRSARPPPRSATTTAPCSPSSARRRRGRWRPWPSTGSTSASTTACTPASAWSTWCRSCRCRRHDGRRRRPPATRSPAGPADELGAALLRLRAGTLAARGAPPGVARPGARHRPDAAPPDGRRGVRRCPRRPRRLQRVAGRARSRRRPAGGGGRPWPGRPRPGPAGRPTGCR